MSEGFHHKSYRRHMDGYKIQPVLPVSHFKEWYLKDNADFWRHLRKHDYIEPLLRYFPASNWLCVGDGRYGTSSMYLKWKGHSATGTDIATELLEESFEKGLIDAFDVQNAESLTYADGAFQFVLCKESYHHFPRPTLALYEMLRVAREAVVLIEPRDTKSGTIGTRFIRSAKNIVKRMVGKQVLHPEKYSYEQIGNFIYTLSEREVEKVALGLDLPAVAFFSFNDVYLPGVENEKASLNQPVFRKMQKELKRLRFLNAIGLYPSNYLITVIFKKMPEAALLEDLRKNGFRVSVLPRNPYI